MDLTGSDILSDILVGLGITTAGFGLLTAAGCAIYKYYKFNGSHWIRSNEAHLVLTPRIVSLFRNYTSLRNALSDSSSNSLSNVIVQGMVGKHPSVKDDCIPELDLSIYGTKAIDVDTGAASMITAPCYLAKLLTTFILKDSEGNELVTVNDESGKFTMILKSLIRKRENAHYLQYNTPVAIIGDAELENTNKNITLLPKVILKPITEQFMTISLNKIIIRALIIGIAGGLVAAAILWCRYRRRRRNDPIPPRVDIHQPRDPIQEVGHLESDGNDDEEEEIYL